MFDIDVDDVDVVVVEMINFEKSLTIFIRNGKFPLSDWAGQQP